MSTQETAFAWYAIRVASGQEKVALHGLTEQKFKAYLPVEVRLRRIHRKKTQIRSPLFPGYMFVALSEDEPEFAAVRGIHAVRGFVSVAGANGAPAVIPTHMVDRIAASEAAGEFDYSIPTKRRKQFKAGQLVRLAGGAFFGALAVFVEEIGDADARIELKGLGGGRMKVNHQHLEEAA